MPCWMQKRTILLMLNGMPVMSNVKAIVPGITTVRSLLPPERSILRCQNGKVSPSKQLSLKDIPP